MGLAAAPPPPLELKAQLMQQSASIKLTWINPGPATLLLNVGSIAGTSGFLPNPIFYIRAAGVHDGNLVYTAGQSVMEGKLEPWVVCLPAKTEFAVSFDLRQLILPGYQKTLAEIQGQPYHLSISFIGRPAFHSGPTPDHVIPYNTTAEYGADFPFWTGLVKAEIVNTPHLP